MTNQILPAVRSVGELTPTEIAAPVVVVIVVVTRLYYGGVVFSPRYLPVWATVRRIAAPLVQRLLYSTALPSVDVEQSVSEKQYVETVDLSPRELALRLDGYRMIEIPLLAGLKTDWEETVEDGTFCYYYGGSPFGLPRWLRPKQVHVTVFERNGKTVVTAHAEANPWRPDKWMDHLYQGPSYSIESGVERTHRALKDAEVV